MSRESDASSTDEITAEMAATGYVALWEALPETMHALSPERGTEIAIAVYVAMKSERATLA
jgi:hypothetical protein